MEWQEKFFVASCYCSTCNALYTLFFTAWRPQLETREFHCILKVSVARFPSHGVCSYEYINHWSDIGYGLWSWTNDQNTTNIMNSREGGPWEHYEGRKHYRVLLHEVEDRQNKFQFILCLCMDTCVSLCVRVCMCMCTLYLRHYL